YRFIKSLLSIFLCLYSVLGLHCHPFFQRSNTGSDIWFSINDHNTVRTSAYVAEYSSWLMSFFRISVDHNTFRFQSRGNRLSFISFHCFSVKTERYFLFFRSLSQNRMFLNSSHMNSSSSSSIMRTVFPINSAWCRFLSSGLHDSIHRPMPHPGLAFLQWKPGKFHLYFPGFH